jgi:hypothetical protein
LVAHTERSNPTTSSSKSMASTAKSSGIQCFKCGGRGHVIKECPNNRTILVNDQGEYESASEEEMKTNLRMLLKLMVSRHVNSREVLPLL